MWQKIPQNERTRPSGSRVRRRERTRKRWTTSFTCGRRRGYGESDAAAEGKGRANAKSAPTSDTRGGYASGKARAWFLKPKWLRQTRLLRNIDGERNLENTFVNIKCNPFTN